MSSVVYTTNEWDGYGKQSRYYSQYRLEGDTVVKYNRHEFKHFDGKENSWEMEERVVDSWALGDPNMPEWLNKHL